MSSASSPSVEISSSKSERSSALKLLAIFGASTAVLYFELLVIRYVGTEIRIFAYLKNLALIASFCGIGIGMVLTECPARVRRWVPVFFAALFLLTRFSGALGLTHIGMLRRTDEFVWGRASAVSPVLATIVYVAGLATLFMLTLGLFIYLGFLVGRALNECKPLPGYSANLAGSLAGMLLFSAMSFYETPPSLWLLAGALLLLPFVYRERAFVLTMLGVVLFTAIPQPHTYWSPYYRIDFEAAAPPPGWQAPAVRYLSVNHDYHQKALDLSQGFVSRYPDYSPNKEALRRYELPYNMAGNPGYVLVVGAGTGNDVAAALRHGAWHVDAVEIDPVIARLGRQYHPEHPYESPRVSVIVNDARAFFNQADRKYDLIIFGHLDSHTLASSFSSLRLDNYVYTIESFRSAAKLLREGGSMFVAFASGDSFVTSRQFATLTRAVGAYPRSLVTHDDGFGVVLVYGKAQTAPAPAGSEDITARLIEGTKDELVTTDAWPFLYLRHRSIPLWTILGLLVVWICVKKTVRNTIGFGVLRDRRNAHFFLLGAGFLLLETHAICKLSLLFGSTWVVNAVVISAFLIMALAANMIVLHSKAIPKGACYVCLAIALIVSSVVPYERFTSSMLSAWLAAFLIATPVFFSGLIFSSSLRSVQSSPTFLGINILGAVLGGLLENFMMIGGTPAVSILALMIYISSALVLRGSRAQEAAV